MVRRLAVVVSTILLSVGCTSTSPIPSPTPSIQPSAPAPAPPLPTAGPTAEFTVTALEFVGDPLEVVPDSQVDIEAEIRNVGPVAGVHRAELTVDGTPVAQQEVSLDAGEGTRLSFSIVAGPAGSHEVRLGDARLVIAVLGPAVFELGVPAISPSPAKVQDSLDVAVEVINRGGLTGSHVVELAVDGTVLETREVTVPGGDRTTVTFEIPPRRAGRHTVTVNEQAVELIVWDIQRPASGTVIVDKLGPGEGRLTVDNDTDEDALIVLVKRANPRKALLVVYVRSGRTDTLFGVNDGTYLLFYRLGRQWDSHSRRFTADDSRGRFRDPFRFTTTTATYTVWTVDLKPSVLGNAPTDEVDESEFPGD